MIEQSQAMRIKNLISARFPDQVISSRSGIYEVKPKWNWLTGKPKGYGNFFTVEFDANEIKPTYKLLRLNSRIQTVALLGATYGIISIGWGEWVQMISILAFIYGIIGWNYSKEYRYYHRQAELLIEDFGICNAVGVERQKAKQSQTLRHRIVSDLSSFEIATLIELQEVNDDCENYWEWTIGTEDQTLRKIDIYRINQDLVDVETQIFISLWTDAGLQPLEGDLEKIIIEKLLATGCEKIYYGSVSSQEHHHFNAKVLKEWRRKE